MSKDRTSIKALITLAFAMLASCTAEHLESAANLSSAAGTEATHCASIAAEHPTADEPHANMAVGGTSQHEVELREGRYVAGPFRIEEPLPDGYPRPTPPGLIEIKQYPSVRRAEVAVRGDPNMGSSFAFFPLFNHIQEREIAMTSPVEMDYDRFPGVGNGGAGELSWRMSFLYRRADLGPTGDDGTVVVYDTQPITVVSIGINGPYGTATFQRGLKQLEAWLNSQTAWERVSAPRTFSYNGPSIPNARKWSEVQIPIQPAGTRVSTRE